MAMEYPYVRVESIDSYAGLSSAVEFRIAKDETNVSEAALVAAVAQVVEDSGLPPATATRFSLAQEVL
ncbi:hypothetical protein K378_01454 [Streptomyces sp. Amel2xB2]|uniref:hypothetical protein n=1 Tax=Streptomyces sp. Amel2xB2 TaxID=1305829 RepID=UPI000DB92ECB|nr:hypothetical protein [Streptomyces sp. Amel2xB2]RAJ70289.1 hypothetical protein K378_01454 [Streptomyces sp. Amel2xB2]